MQKQEKVGMMEKISWYQEVLELEPSSRVFFPLAKLLVKVKENKKAIATLKHGISRHPDHIEARLFLVELLSADNAQAELSHELDSLGELFGKYPNFWRIWSQNLARNPGMKDAALAIVFFAACLGGKDISWSSVMEQGLKELLKSHEEHNFFTEISRMTETGEMPSVAEPDLSVQDESLDDAPSSGLEKKARPEASSDAQESLKKLPPISLETPDESDESYSLRTRSMAEVLAEQGDITGASEILEELLSSAPEDEKSAIKARMEELKNEGGVVASSVDKPKESEKKTEDVEGNRLVSVLESLAQRFEDRAE